ncbi:hypothetical protein ACS0TY_000061 [Phlomoides rotata]
MGNRVLEVRYGWFSKAEVESATTLEVMRNSSFSIAEEQNVEIENTNALYSKHITPINTVGSGSSVSNINITQFQDNPAVVSSLGTQHGDLAFAEHFETKDMVVSATERADRTTNINPDSFDADIVTFLQKNQNNDDLEQCVTPQEPSTSIWDADEACDAFSFQRNHSICDKGYSSSTPSSFPSHKEVEGLLQEFTFKDSTPNCGGMMDDRRPVPNQENPSKDDGLTDIYWPDCLRPLYLGIPSCTDNTNDLFPSDSLGGLNHLIANSVDAFHSCSMLDKKEPASTSEALQTASSDFRIRSPQTLNDVLCISLDSIWFLSTHQEMCGITGIIKKIIANGAYEFTRVALRTSFLASCVSTCKSRTMSLGDTVTVMSKRKVPIFDWWVRMATS